MQTESIEKNMTVKFSVYINDDDECIVDDVFETYSNYVEEFWYEEYFGSRCYSQYVEECIANGLVDNIIEIIINNAEDVTSWSDDFIDLIKDEVYEEIERFDFDVDTETLWLNINV